MIHLWIELRVTVSSLNGFIVLNIEYLNIEANIVRGQVLFSQCSGDP